MRKQHSMPVVGGSSLLVIFAVLTLTIFALLSISTAQAGTRLSRQSTQAVYAYYEADAKAEAIFSQLRSGTIPDGVCINGEIYTYVCPISDTQELQVTIRRNNDNSFSVLQWQSVSTAKWQADENIDVWNGEQ